MYVEPVRNVVTAKVQQAASQTAETDHIIQTESTEGEAEYGTKEQMLYHTDTRNSSDTLSVAEQQSAESEKLKKAIERMNEQLPNSEAKFGIHEATNRVMITLVDKDTQEVIKEIPPEKTLDMLAKCMEMAGVLVDQKL